MVPVTSFPLLRLPKNATMVPLRAMAYIELIGISLVSKKCKNLVNSIGIKSEPIKCKIARSIELGFVFNGPDRLYLEFIIKDKENEKYVLKRPSETVEIRFYRNGLQLTRYTLSKNHMEVSEWLEHLQFLFGCSKLIDILFTEQSSGFNIDSLKETFHEAHHLVVLHSGCYSFNKLILRKFLSVKFLIVSPSCFQDARIPPDILIQNIPTFCTEKRNVEQLTNLKLNDWLMMNSRIIGIHNLQKSLKEFNMFLKLWMNGSNPSLEYITFRYLDWNKEDVNIVMKGIKNHKMPRTLARKHRCFNWIVYGGFDIHRYDGVKATVLVGRTAEGQASFSMFVWHDHCIVP